MTTPSTYAFASPSWVGALHGVLVGLADELVASLDGSDFLVCEVYTDVPAWVSPTARVATTWGVLGGELTFSQDEVEASAVDMKIVADWEVIAPIGSAVGDDVLPLQLELPKAMADGRFSAEITGTPPAYLSVIHDAVAGITDNTPPS